MEIIIVLVILGVGVWWFFMRNIVRGDDKSSITASYKVEAPAPVAEPVKAETPKVEVIPAGTEASIAAPAKKAKAPAKPKAPAKTAAKAPAKAPAKTAKPKAPAKPKITVAK